MIEKRITRGVALLDANSPHGPAWVFHVNIDILDMADWANCVLGQLYDSYTDGVQRLLETKSGIIPADVLSVNYGFELHSLTGDTFGLDEYRELTTAWRTRIINLRSARRTLEEIVSTE